ncbi:type 1 glutamine amidotransferase domain-containing protein [Shewanella inventionis]|uniref:Dimethylallyltransferase n=1 Tax=Shewanella inventionis TaxID=1738770 RepID=A0ABQ1IXS8_9GAMM|nr:type 1 glutamine amidotransferase domain-containing protein [Shewanella inventionis]MCL1157067.1 type 1 glutamine amidotransferase domain-containing protein [Shewanella inventionis]UAL44502.1 type 1 glutamine amidotransferase domain-containing protein [Shewanella inventionis]GGB54970.1 dimethylallyltransferase [Shewanella inventionis]
MKVLMVLTSHDKLGDTGHKTGFWLEELAAPYYTFADKGIEVVLASPKGGLPPLDPKSDEADFQTDATRRFAGDTKAQALLANTHKLAAINVADYDAVFYPGGHGPLWDLTNDKDSIALIEQCYQADKLLGLVCHAPGVLKYPKKADGSPLVAGKNVTGFTNSEEDAVQLTHVVPFLVEDMLQHNGAVYSKGDDWHPYVVVDGKLITGQNPASSELVAEKMLALLN